MKTKFRHTHILSLIFSILIIGFSTSLNAQTESEPERIYIKIEIKGMACPYCSFGMVQELKKVVGVGNVEIEFKEGLAFISTPMYQNPTKESLEKIITEAGFTVGEIEFSDKPFKRTKSKKKK
ncbi:MAG: hypothetical protein COA50_16645 [Flavobacteriaceae bacterium]|nr:MAG: hypothetical protein COA50_16645 [Flavobacteriaceae bacterium]